MINPTSDLHVYGFLSDNFFFSWRLITLQYCSGFCHTLKWISHGFTCVPHPDSPSHLPLHPIPLGLPSAETFFLLMYLHNIPFSLNVSWACFHSKICYVLQYLWLYHKLLTILSSINSTVENIVCAYLKKVNIEVTWVSGFHAFLWLLTL